MDVRDAGIRSNWGQRDPRPCTILMMEVLDNCPHDKASLAPDLLCLCMPNITIVGSDEGFPSICRRCTLCTDLDVTAVKRWQGSCSAACGWHRREAFRKAHALQPGLHSCMLLCFMQQFT